ncbi:hypothetical protein KKH43_03345 [Patescibacteria group bacterium]|nr:hypothetical protein [Patescibacteria group bacterium]
MGIVVEFNPDLALRNITECKEGRRRKEECIPENLEKGYTYSFLKKDQRNYWLFGEIPLIETKGNQILSRPKANIQILEATHFVENGEMYTRGTYTVIEVFNDDEIHFECFDKIGVRD